MPESVLRFRVETADANAKIAHLTKKVQGLEVAVLKAGGTTKTAGTSFKTFGAGAQAAAVGAKGLGAALGAALGPITAVVAAAGSLGQVFGILSKQDFAEAKVRSLGVDSKELTGRLKEVSRELSGQASVVELTGAAYDVASAGFNDAASASKILKAASLGATGGFSDINTVADATTSVLNAYGMEADKAGKLVDGFIQTQNDGKIVIGEYAANIAKVAPVAAALGVPLEEVNAAVAQITAGGQGAEVTFTALKTAFAQVAAGKVGQEFKKLGVEINASTLKSDGLAGTLEKIKKSGADAGTVIKAFGTEAGPSILALLNDTEKYNKLLENQKQAQDTAAKAAFQASDTINGQLKRLQTAFSNLFSDQSELGVLLKETFKVAAVTVEVLTATINTLLSPIRAVFAAVHQIGQAIGEALGITGVNAAFELEQGFQFIIGAVSKVQAFIIGFGAQIGRVIGGLAGFVVQKGKGATDSITGFFRSALEKIVGFIKGAYNLIPEPIRRFLEGSASIVREKVGGFIRETVELGQGFSAGAGLQKGTPETAANNVVATGGALKKGKAKKFEMPGFSGSGLDPGVASDLAFSKEIEQLTKVNMLMEARLEGTEKEEQRREKIAEIIERAGITEEEGVANAKRVLKNIFAQTDALEEQARVNEKNKQLFESIGATIKDGIVDTIMSAIDGSKSLGESLTGILKQIGGTFLQAGIGQLGQGLKIPGFASGGSISAGKPAIVGERGPELFVPGRSGSIIPNDALGGAGSITVNVDASGSTVEGNADQANQLGKAIGIAVQQELIKQKRPGGLLAGV